MNIGSLLTKSATIHPDHLALVHGRKRLTYAQFHARANRLANALMQLGIRAGENVALLQFNCPEMLESMFACFKAGFGAVPINFRLHPNEFAYIINNAQARAVIISEEFNWPMLDIRNDISQSEFLITVSGAEKELIDYEDLLSAESDRFTDAETTPEDVAWLFYTSGTTG